MTILKKVIPNEDVRYFEIGDKVSIHQNEKNTERWKSCSHWEWELDFTKEKSNELIKGPSHSDGSHFYYSLGLGKIKKVFKNTVWIELI